MSKTLDLLKENFIVDIPADNGYGLHGFSGKFSFFENNTEFELFAYEAGLNFIFDNDIIHWTNDPQSIHITISQVKNDGRNIFAPQTYALPNDITDINLLCAYLWYACKNYDLGYLKCNKSWFLIGKENKFLLPWEKKYAEEKARSKRIQDNSYICDVEKGYGHAFRSRIYELIVQTYNEALYDAKTIEAPQFPISRAETKQMLTAELISRLQQMFRNHSISFYHDDNILTATVWIDNHIHKTQVIANSNRKWDKQYLVDVFDFLAATPRIPGQLTVGIYDYQENGNYILCFGTEKFKGKIQSPDIIDCSDDNLNDALNELVVVLNELCL